MTLVWPWKKIVSVWSLHLPTFNVIRLTVLIWPLVTPDDLGMTLKSFLSIQGLHLPTFNVIRLTVLIWPLVTPDDLGLTLEKNRLCLKSTSTNFQCYTTNGIDLTSGDPGWPWNDLENFPLHPRSTCTKFQCHMSYRMKLTLFDPVWPSHDLSQHSNSSGV